MPRNPLRPGRKPDPTRAKSAAELRRDGLSGKQLDIEIPQPVGRLCKAWGTDKRKERQARRAVVLDLVRAGQLQVLADFKAGRLAWADLLYAKREKRLDADSLSADLSLARDLRVAFTEALPKMGKQQSTRGSYREAFDSLFRRAADVFVLGSSVQRLGTADWPAVWATHFADVSPAWRNRVRSAVSAFLTIYLDDRFHPFARATRKKMGSKEKEPAVPMSISSGEFWSLMEHVDPVLVPTYVTLAATGLRVSEYLALTADSLARFPTVTLPTTKAGRPDVVEVDPVLEPYIRAAVPCRLPVGRTRKPKPGAYRDRDPRYYLLDRQLRRARKATGIPATVHTLRHYFVAEGVKAHPESFVQQAVRHETPEMTARYARQRDSRLVAGTVGKALRDAARESAPAPTQTDTPVRIQTTTETPTVHSHTRMEKDASA